VTKTRALATSALLVAVVAVVACPSRARAAGADPDPWFGQDKAAHFGVSAAIAAGGYGLGAAIFDARGHALIAGGALAIAAGAFKETLDLTGSGTASWKDLAWDGLGTVAGLAVAWTADLLIRGVSEKHPLLITPRVEKGSAGLELRLRF
jgi:putative lipoprotein